MLQFGEMLTLAIAAVVTVYLAVNWRHVWNLPRLRGLLGPFFLMTVGWVATVTEGLFIQDPEAFPLVVVGAKSVDAAQTATLGCQLLNGIEHVAYLAAAVWLLVIVIRTLWSSRNATA